MGLFDDIGEFFTGNKQRAAQEDANNRARKAAEQAEQAAALGLQLTRESAAGLGKSADEANELARRYNAGALESFGANAADFMRLADQAAQSQADQNAQATSMQAARQALAAARTAGVNKGQAALRAAQQTGDVFSNARQSGLESARQQYERAANAFAGQGATQQGIGMNANIAKSNIGQGQQGLGQQGFIQSSNLANQAVQNAQTSSMIGGSTLANVLKGVGQMAGQSGAGAGAGAAPAGAATSDVRMKDRVMSLVSKVREPLKELADNVPSASFHYTGQSGDDPGKERVGVMAQDLENTAMKDNVIDTPEGKKVDTAQQTMSNTAYIAEMARELYELKAQLRKLEGGQA